MAETNHSVEGTIIPGPIREAVAHLEGLGVPTAIQVDRGMGHIWIKPHRSHANASLKGLRRLVRCMPIPASADLLHNGRIERYWVYDSLYRAKVIGCWGFPHDLVAAGIAPEQRVSHGRNWSKGGILDYGWESYFAPSGRVLYRRPQPRDSEAPQEAAAVPGRPALRLVWSNGRAVHADV